MKKNKLQSLLSLCLVSCLLASCSAYFDSSVPDELELLERKKSVDVLQIRTHSDGLIYFSNKYPGKLRNGQVNGIKQVPLQLFASDSIAYRTKKVKEIPLYVYSEGRKFDVLNQNDLSLVYSEDEAVVIPFSEITDIQFRKNKNSTLVLSGLVTGLAGLSVWILSNMSFNFDDAF